MRVSVLGRFHVAVGGHAVALGGPQQRLTLALLAVRPGRFVPVDELIDGVWGEDLPGRPRKALQVYVANLRRALGPARWIVSEPSGYRLAVDPGHVDSVCFERLVAEARRARDAGDAATAGDRYAEALALWHGEPFADLPGRDALRPAIVRLQELRMAAVEERLALELDRRPAAESVAELEELCRAHPIRERLWALLVTALYRAGRQADALAAYQRVRSVLAETLGLEPSPALRDLERRVLQQDPSLDAPVPESPPAPAPPAAERRSVTVVSCALADLGAQHDPEDLAGVVERFHAEATSVLAAHGGVVAAAGHGEVVASFGAPSSGPGHAADAVRAALAAVLGAARLPSPSPVRARAGIHTGVAVVESCPGGGVRVGGDVPLVASRVQARAGDGEVLATPATAALLGPEFATEATGDDDGVRVSAAPRPMPAARPAPLRLVGRDRELADLRARVDEPGPAVPVVVVTGEPGVGKSALVAAVPGASAGWATVACSAVPRLRATALHPFAAAMAPVVPGTPADVLAWLDAVAGGGRLLLVVEDAPDLDDASAEVVAVFVHQGGPGAVVLTARQPALPGPLARIVTATVELGPLDAASARALVRQVAGPAALSIAAVDEIVRRSGGVPLYLHELTAATAAASGDAVPVSLEASLFARLDRLGPAKATAQACAVIGTEFTLDLARAVTGLPPADAAEHVGVLVGAGVLDDVPGRPEPTYRFRHAVVEDVAYRSLLRSARAELHGRLAQDGDALARLPAEVVATHLEAAQRLPQAAERWCEAALAAVARSRFPEAAAHARRALALVGDLPPGEGRDRLELRASLGLGVATQMALSGSEETLAALARARDLAARLHRPDVLPVTYPASIASLQALGRYHEAAAVGVEGLALAARTGDGRLERVVRHFHAATLVWTGQVGAGERLLAPLLDGDRAALPGAPGAAADCGMVALAGLVDWVQDRAAVARARFAEAAGLAAAASAPQAMCLVRATEAVTRQLEGDVAAVHRLAEGTVELALELGNDWWFVWGQVLLGWSVAAGADRRGGIAMMREGIDHAGPVKQLRPWFLALLAEQEAAAGDVEGAARRLAAARALVEETGERFFLPEILRVEAGVTGDREARCRAVATARDQSQWALARRAAGQP